MRSLRNVYDGIVTWDFNTEKKEKKEKNGKICWKSKAIFFLTPERYHESSHSFSLSLSLFAAKQHKKGNIYMKSIEKQSASFRFFMPLTLRCQWKGRKNQRNCLVYLSTIIFKQYTKIESTSWRQSVQRRRNDCQGGGWNECHHIGILRFRQIKT